MPGRQDLSIFATIGIGIAGSIVGGLIGRLLFGDNYTPGLIMSTLTAAALIYVLTRSRAGARR